MKFSTFGLVASLAVAIGAPALGQGVVFNAASVVASCQSNDCAAGAQGAVGEIRASGLAGGAFSGQLAELSKLLYTNTACGGISAAQGIAGLRAAANGATDPTQKAAINDAADRLASGRASCTGPLPPLEASGN